MKSPLEQVWRQFVPQGHDQALRNAFYNVAAAVFVIGAAAAAFSVYLILQPFVQALLWAVLFGSVLHPIKHKLSTGVRRWLLNIQETKSLLSLSLLLSPITCLDSLSEFIGRFVMNHMKGVIAVTVILPILFIVIHHTPAVLSQVVYTVISFNYNVVKFSLDIVIYMQYAVLAIIVVYFLIIMMNSGPENDKILKKFSLPIWMLIIASFSCLWPSINVPLFIALSLLLFGGLWIEVIDKQFRLSGESNIISLIVEVIQGIELSDISLKKMEAKQSIEDILEEEPENNEAEKLEKLDTEEEISKIEHCVEQDAVRKTPKLILPQIKHLTSDLDTEKKTSFADNNQPKPNLSTSCDEENSNKYLKAVFIACVLIELWRHSYFLSLLPISLGYYCVKKVASYHVFGEGFFHRKMNEAKSKFHSWFELKRKIFLPLPLRGVIKLLKRTDIKVVKVFVDSVDSIVTILIMLAVLFFFVLASIFLAVQLQGEGMQLIAIGSKMVNSTIVNNPQLRELLPEGIREFLHTALDNGYLYGREWISNMIKGIVDETNDEKAEVLEKQVILLWDRIYQTWAVSPPEPPYHSPRMTPEAVVMTFDSIINGLVQTPGLVSFATLSDVLRDNLGTVMSVTESVWTILLSNLSLVFSAFTAISSSLLGGSLSILNALFNVIVFLSALFYILSVSDSVYKPVAILSGLAPGQMNSLGATVEESVNGVFRASFKMGAFYGMWTWLLHSIFATNMVYIPAVLGALFGAIPLVGTYWAAVPGALELFWGHESPFLALLLVLFQLLPLIFVDAAFYAEIKGGGHPYLTGLAVAGGIFCWGVEGAILGPLLLCILLVITKMYATLIQSPSDIMHKFKTFRRCQSDFTMLN